MTIRDELKQRAVASIDRMSGELLDVSHAIHAHPELAFEEVEAARILTAAAEHAGLTVRRGAYGLATAFESEFGRAGGPCVAMLAEYDALPGIGHACGHNLIATAGLGASLALAALGADLPGRIRFLGTPAEEKGGGKELMAREGAFAGVDAAMMVHPAGLDLATMPCIAVAEVNVTYRGKPSHASAMPHLGINALDALVTAYQAIAQLRQHIRPTERIHGIITNGGQAANIVPELAAACFYVRARNVEDLAPLKERVERCFLAGAMATGAEVDVDWRGVDYLDLNTSWPLADAYQRNAEALGRTFVPMESLPQGMAGSTDMGNVSYRVPSIHPMISCAPPNVMIHNQEFAHWAGSERGDAAALDGAKALAMTALDYLLDEGLRDEARRQFEKTKHVLSLPDA